MKKNIFNRIGFLTLLAMTFGRSFLNAQPDYTLAKCLDRVRTAATATQQIARNQQLSQIERKVISRNYYPQASLGAKATWQSEVTSIPIDLPNLEIPSVPNTQYALTLDFTQPIYDGGVTKALLEIKSSELEINGAQFHSILLESEKQAIHLFYQIALQEELIKINDLLIEQLDQNITRAEVAAENGVLIKQDILSIEVRRREIIQQKGENQAVRMAAVRALTRLMGQSDTVIDISHRDFDQIPVDDQFNRRPEVALQEIKIGLITAQEQLNQAQVQPTLGVFVNTGYGRPGLNFLNDQFDFYALAGIKLSVPLGHFYNRKLMLQKESFKIQHEMTQLQKEELTRTFSIQSQNYLEEINKLVTWLADDQDIIEMREQILAVSKAQWEGSTLSTTDYLNAITDLSVAKTRMVSHEILLNQARALLYNLSGNYILN